MNKITSLTLMLLLTVATNAQQPTSLQQIASQQLSQMGLSGQPQIKEETSTYAIYGTEQGGFVILSKTESTPRVLAYSQSAYDPSRQPCGFKWWMSAVSEVLSGTAPTVRRAQSYTPVANFLETEWDQDAPYNDKCPTIAGSHAPTGCIATAMAQVMRYYEWPAQGRGTGGYYLGDYNSTFYKEDINGTYQWAKMPYVPYSSGTKSEIKDAVSTLLYDCGLSVKMQYDNAGSGAYEFDQALALARNFQYDSLSLKLCYRDFYNTDQWMAMIDNEMQHKRPILYSGFSQSDGGHAFVFSGLDGEGRVYVNWGWSGYCDGYYSIDAIAPTSWGKQIYDFTKEQSMSIGIKPMSANGPDGVYRSQWFGMGYYNPIKDYRIGNQDKTKLIIPYYYIENYNFLPFVGRVGLLIESTDGQGYSQLKLIEEMVKEELGFGDAYTNFYDNGSGQYSYDEQRIAFDELPVGNYQLSWASQAIQEDTPVKVITDDGSLLPAFYIAKAEDGTLTFSRQVISTGIRNVAQTGATPAPRTYDLSGRETNGRQHGLTIVRQGDSVRKVVR